MTDNLFTGDLSLALLSIDTHWAIEARYGAAMLHTLRGIDYAAHYAAWQAAEAERQKQLAAKAAAGSLSAEDVGYAVNSNGTALFSISGPIAKKRSSFGGGASTVELRRMVRHAKTNTDVKRAAFKTDSPGGQVSGLFDLVDDIEAFTQVKPTLTYIEDLAASAAFATSCPTALIVANPTALVGCIGTYMTLYDTSRMAQNQGVEAHVIRAGKFKGAGTPGTKLTTEQLDEFQREVESLNAFFLAAVAKGRGMTPEQVAEIADGRMWIAAEAQAMGLIDGVGSWDDALTLLETQSGSAASLKARRPAAIVLPAKDFLQTSEDIVFLSLASLPAAATPTLPTQQTSDAPHPAKTQAPAQASHSPKETPMKDKLVQMLSALNLRRMAVAVVGVQGDDHDALVAAMAQNVEEEVKARLAAHPVLAACAAAGIASVSDLEKVLDMKAIGETAFAELRDEAKKEAIRAFGPVAGQVIGASVDNVGMSNVKTLKNAWAAQADETYKITATGAARQTKAAEIAQSANAETGKDDKDQPKTAWERLDEKQKAHAKAMGHVTAEAQEKYAAQVLSLKGEGK